MKIDVCIYIYTIVYKSAKMSNLCKYCRKSTNDYVTTNCAHSTGEFLCIFRHLHKRHPKTVDDYLHTQPPSLVIDAICALNPSLEKEKITIDFEKCKKLLLENLDD